MVLLLVAVCAGAQSGEEEAAPFVWAAADWEVARQELWLAGSPSLAQLVRWMPQSIGANTEHDGFAAEGLEGVVNLNLRGLGPGRSLVLLDGQRLGTTPLGLPGSGELFANLAQVPISALERVEVRTTATDSAALAPGALTGAVDLRTRSDFLGSQMSYGKEFVDPSGGDEVLSALWGSGEDSGKLLLALEVGERDVLRHPSSPVLAGCPLEGELNPDLTDDCWDSGAYANRINDTGYQKLYGRYSSRHLDGTQREFSALWARAEVVGPTPPGRAFRTDGADAFAAAPATNPGFADALARGYSEADLRQGLQTREPALGAPADRMERMHQSRRFSYAQHWFDDSTGRHYRIDALSAISEAEVRDIRVDHHRLDLALQGYGGPGCDLTTQLASGSLQPGQGGCQYYNPLPTGFRALAGMDSPNQLLYYGENPAENPATDNVFTEEELAALTNSPELQAWLLSQRQDRYKSRLSDLRIHLGGRLGGSGQWRAGAVWREESWRIRPGQGDSRGGNRFSRALFTDWQIPLAQSLDLLLSLRSEDYGPEAGDVLLPGLTLHWHNGVVSVRLAQASVARAPDLNQVVGGAPVPLQFASGQQFLVVAEPNHGLKLEEAERTNLVLSLSGARLELKLETWMLDIESPIELERGTAAMPTARYLNGTSVQAEGTDLRLNYSLLQGEALGFALGADWARLDSWKRQSEELAGRFDLYPLPKNSSTAWLQMNFSRHNLRVQSVNRSGYQVFEAGAPTAEVEDWQSWELHYLYRYRDGNTRLYISVLNLSDEEPAVAPGGLGYDSWHQSALGRVTKIGFHHSFP